MHSRIRWTARKRLLIEAVVGIRPNKEAPGMPPGISSELFNKSPPALYVQQGGDDAAAGQRVANGGIRLSR